MQRPRCGGEAQRGRSKGRSVRGVSSLPDPDPPARAIVVATDPTPTLRDSARALTVVVVVVLGSRHFGCASFFLGGNPVTVSL